MKKNHRLLKFIYLYFIFNGLNKAAEEIPKVNTISSALAEQNVTSLKKPLSLSSINMFPVKVNLVFLNNIEFDQLFMIVSYQ